MSTLESMIAVPPSARRATSAAADPMELVAMARAGRPGALGDLCALYRNYLRALARAGLGWKLRERVEVSDVVQDALVEVVRQFPRFSGQSESALTAWLRHLVGQKLADLGRHHARIKRGAGDSPLPLDTPRIEARRDGEGPPERLADALALSQTSPSEVASRRELGARLAQALAVLPEREAGVLRLYYVEGLSFEAIAARMGLGRKAVCGLWARGLKGLRRSVGAPPIVPAAS